MAVTRGALVTVVLPGGLGKPRPALVIQSHLFAALGSVTILPITSHLRDAPLFRLTVEPTAGNGLRTRSQIMVDKPMTVRRDRLGEAFGQLDDTTILAATRALALFLGFG